jgi:hypothetical protein
MLRKEEENGYTRHEARERWEENTAQNVRHYTAKLSREVERVSFFLRAVNAFAHFMAQRIWGGHEVAEYVQHGMDNNHFMHMMNGNIKSWDQMDDLLLLLDEDACSFSSKVDKTLFLKVDPSRFKNYCDALKKKYGYFFQGGVSFITVDKMSYWYVVLFPIELKGKLNHGDALSSAKSSGTCYQSESVKEKERQKRYEESELKRQVETEKAHEEQTCANETCSSTMLPESKHDLGSEDNSDSSSTMPPESRQDFDLGSENNSDKTARKCDFKAENNKPDELPDEILQGMWVDRVMPLSTTDKGCEPKLIPLSVMDESCEFDPKQSFIGYVPGDFMTRFILRVLIAVNTFILGIALICIDRPYWISNVLFLSISECSLICLLSFLSKMHPALENWVSYAYVGRITSYTQVLKDSGAQNEEIHVYLRTVVKRVRGIYVRSKHFIPVPVRMVTELLSGLTVGDDVAMRAYVRTKIAQLGGNFKNMNLTYQGMQLCGTPLESASQIAFVFLNHIKATRVIEGF